MMLAAKYTIWGACFPFVSIGGQNTPSVNLAGTSMGYDRVWVTTMYNVVRKIAMLVCVLLC